MYQLAAVASRTKTYFWTATYRFVTHVTRRLDRRPSLGESGEGREGGEAVRAPLGHWPRSGPVIITAVDTITADLAIIECVDATGFKETFHVTPAHDGLVLRTTWRGERTSIRPSKARRSHVQHAHI